MKEINTSYQGHSVVIMTPDDGVEGDYHVKMVVDDGREIHGEYRVTIMSSHSASAVRIGQYERNDDYDLLNQAFESLIATEVLALNKARVAQMIHRRRTGEYTYMVFRVPEKRNPLGLYVMVVVKDDEATIASLMVEVSREDRNGAIGLQFEFEQEVTRKQFEVYHRLLMDAVGEEFTHYFSSRDFQGAN